MTKFAWARPCRLVEEAGSLRIDGWFRYDAGQVPALWRRVADFQAYGEASWQYALQEYGPPDSFNDMLSKAHARERWGHTIRDLMMVAALWSERCDHILELPTSRPIEVTSAYKALQNNLQLLLTEGRVQLVVKGLDLVPETSSLAGYIWLAAKDAVQHQHRFRRCERCSGWMRVQRSDARFCSASCRNASKEEAV